MFSRDDLDSLLARSRRLVSEELDCQSTHGLCTNTDVKKYAGPISRSHVVDEGD